MRIILNIGMAGRALPVLLALLLPAAVSASDAGAVAAATSAGAGEPAAAIETSFAPADEPAPGLEHGKAFTGDATPVEPGRIEVEMAYAPTWWATAGAVDRAEGERHLMGVAVGVGLLRDLDARMAVSWAFVRAAPEFPGAPTTGSGPADTSVALRWRFLRLDAPAIDLAVAAAVTIPTGLRALPDRLGTGGEAWSGALSLLASGDWGRFTTNLELGFSTVLGPQASNDVGLLVCNAAVGYQALPWLQPELELNYQHELEQGQEPDESVLWGTAALVLPLDPVRLVVGARFPVMARNAAVGPMATAAVKVTF
ncbi:MAG TPA: hypothetical protein VFM53_00820 [Anaeromyxobacteraceae bacterium]|nr:hypothetical protein [Anaeromyxobacteraceae bacterium]